MAEPGSRELGLVTKGCVYVLDSLTENGNQHERQSDPGCRNSAYQVNTTLGLDFINHTETTADPYASYAIYMRSLETTPIDLIKYITVILYTVGVVANILLLTYIVKFRRYTSPTFALIFSLAICDVGTCVCAVVFAIIVMPTVTGPGWLCEFLIWITTVFYTSSVCHMIFFSVLRFCQLLFPLVARAKITVSLVTRICICFWIINCPTSAIVSSFYTSGSFIYQGKTFTICELRAGLQKRHVSFDTAYLFIPNLIIAGFHLVKHVIVLRRSKKKVSEQEQEHARQTTDGRAVTLVIAVFCMTSIPHVLHQYAHFIFGYPKLSFHQVLSQIDINMLYGNSALNPWIYVLAAQSVRRDVITMFRCK